MIHATVVSQAAEAYVTLHPMRVAEGEHSGSTGSEQPVITASSAAAPHAAFIRALLLVLQLVTSPDPFPVATTTGRRIFRQGAPRGFAQGLLSVRRRLTARARGLAS